MANWCNLIALILEICGVGFLITDELGPFAATIRQDYDEVKAKWWQNHYFGWPENLALLTPEIEILTLENLILFAFSGFSLFFWDF